MDYKRLTRKTAWLCDRKKCKNCSDQCRHTSDANHAKYGAIDWRDCPERFTYHSTYNTMWQKQ